VRRRGDIYAGQDLHLCTIGQNNTLETILQISSTFLPPQKIESIEQPAVLMLFDTLVNQKRVVVGITVGKVQGADLDSVRVSAIGQNIITALASHMRLNYPQGAVVVAGVAQVPSAKERVRKVLAQAPEGSGVLLVCADNKVYDAAFPALGVDYQSANMNLH